LYATYIADQRKAQDVLMDGFHENAVLHVLGDRNPFVGHYPSRANLVEKFYQPMIEGPAAGGR
jgi:hypothetical protein